MKYRAAVVLSATFFCLAACSSSEKDSVKQANEQNLNSAIDEDISEFLTEAADARMMNIEQGKLAREKGSSAAIKRYGERMISDQTRLLKDIRMLAASKNIVLPNTISNKKAEGLEDLKEETAEDFDKKFIKMMTVDHRRDVRAFEDATDFRDKDIQKFASSYLPLIQSHLEGIRKLERGEGVNLTERKEEQ